MAANYVLLERIELNASAASVTFSNIPQSGYTDLKVVVSARDGSYGSTLATAYYRFNGDSGANYKLRWLYGNGTAAGSALDNAATVQLIANIPGNTATANTFGNAEIYIPNYTSSNYKSSSVDAVPEGNATGTYQSLSAALWSNTAAINSITFTSDGNFAANSTFSLYGLAAVGTTPVIAPKASGGNITTDGTYWYHSFLSTDSFVPATSLSCDVLVIAGGGGGANGGAGGGGGGAGGLSYQTGRTVSSSTTVTVGAGGAGGGAASGYTAPTNGVDSVFATITSNGGGKGGQGGVGGNGGSGGGGSSQGTPYAGGSATQGNTGGATGYGNAGATATASNTSGGGGGAGAAGGASLKSDGGNGLNTWSAWATATQTGVSGYYAGGGAGTAAGTSGTGGLGGGGTSGGTNTTAVGTAGTTNTGSGGGGGGGNTVGFAGGAGGSGIVIIRYAMA